MEKVNYSNATHRPYNLLRLVGWANSNSVCSRYLNKNLIKIKAKSISIQNMEPDYKTIAINAFATMVN